MNKLLAHSSSFRSNFRHSLRHRLRRLRELMIDFLLILLAILAMTSSSQAAPQQPSIPHLPASHDTVIASLSDSVVELAGQVRASALQESRTGLESNPNILFQQLLSSYEVARRDNNPRAYGHTLGLLQQWPEQVELPGIARLIKAAVLQHNHQFDEALEELALILGSAPHNLQARQMQAQIHLTTGDYERAADDCAQFEARAMAFAAINCQTQLAGLTGESTSVLETLQSLLAENDIDSAARLELLITAADNARRLNRATETIAYYEQVLALAPGNHYALVNYCEWLLEQGRYSEVVTLLSERVAEQNDTELSILYARALQSSSAQRELSRLRDEIDDTVAAMRRRGEDRPHKLIAQHALFLAEEFELATHEALANWQEQREPSDLKLLALAAIASGDQEALALVRDWLQSTGLQDQGISMAMVNAGVQL